MTDHGGTTRRGRLLGGGERGITLQLEQPVAERDRWLYTWGEIGTIAEVTS